MDVTGKECLEAKLRCGICFNKFHPPIYLCTTGHSICKVCKEDLETCPFCMVSINKNMRNLFLEGLCAELKYNCTNKNEGCLELFSCLQIEEHEKFCLFRFLDCPFNGCTFKNNHAELIKHVKSCHSQSFTISNNLKFKYPVGLNDFILTTSNTFFKVCLCTESNTLHVHSFSLEKQDYYSMQLHYETEDINRKIVLTELCNGFDYDCTVLGEKPKHYVSSSDFVNLFQIVRSDDIYIELKFT